MSIQSAQYYRNGKNWHKLLGKRGVVVFATQIEVTSPELEAFLPYCFLLVKLESGQKIEIMGEAQVGFESGDRVVLQLRKNAVPDSREIIPYGLKAIKLA